MIVSDGEETITLLYLDQKSSAIKQNNTNMRQNYI